ncbi:TMAO reductase system periplasmic protein TorT [Pseudaminobacter arsenicus]|uniref:TMAO reductase system periplasmic protein TorT n=1 Tax=Borborobacter arsenicus TaxID=1851146 RepID=A0A432V7U0_9HYPH|nr:TMAO reductase system periplasmic protein TorT [Pseudaminobacter arsenicus]RUM98143.1 TMAO reductase system periplasmic protein TorT [Pseudaminobacter arsenicus]
MSFMHLCVLCTATLGLAVAAGSANERPAAWQLGTWEPPFDYSRPPMTIDYQPVTKAAKPWKICASYPHLKDSYWVSVNYGMVEQAKAAGVGLSVVEAGGYPNLERQIEQIKACSGDADALIVGTVSYDGLTPTIKEIARHIPVIAAVNDIDDAGITAKTGVSWEEMGRSIGAYLAGLHPAGSKPVKVAWFPGPKGAGWVQFVEAGFQKAIKDSSAKITAVKWGDTGLEIQLLLIEELLEAQPDIDYIVGSAPTADAAVSVLRAQNRQGQIKILADYFTHGTFREINRAKVLAAPTDSPPLQGRIAIDQAIRAIEGTLEHRHVGPHVEIVDKNNVLSLDLDQSLAPAWFKPTFEVR